MAYQTLDHTIFIVGWGVDDKQVPYWIARNSYGDEWGMHGDFHVRRGSNDFGIESELSAYDMELLSTSK
jgi:C1A family cysteine protease